MTRLPRFGCGGAPTPQMYPVCAIVADAKTLAATGPFATLVCDKTLDQTDTAFFVATPAIGRIEMIFAGLYLAGAHIFWQPAFPANSRVFMQSVHWQFSGNAWAIDATPNAAWADGLTGVQSSYGYLACDVDGATVDLKYARAGGAGTIFGAGMGIVRLGDLPKGPWTYS